MDGHYIVYIRNKASKLAVPVGFFTDDLHLKLYMNITRMKVRDGYEMYYVIVTPSEYEYFRSLTHGDQSVSPTV